MRILIATLIVILFASCNKNTETTQTTNNTNYQLRLQIVDQNGDTTYSDTKIVR